VDDKIADIKEALRTSIQKAPLVIVTGGLGPTVNDVTREALAEFTGVELREQPEALAEMERRFKMPGISCVLISAARPWCRSAAPT